MFEGSGDGRFRGDDGSADPAAATALSAFAAAEGSERAALAALAGTRLLVPVVAVLSGDGTLAGGAAPAGGGAAAGGPGPADRPALAGGAAGGEKSSEMALPTLVGRDGRSAIPVFTCLESLGRWRSSARPVPAEAALVWRAAVEDSCAVIIDVAGPVPLAVEGARLAALARGDPVPLPHEDPDVREAVAAAVCESAAAAGLAGAGAGYLLRPAAGDSDLEIELALPAGAGQRAAEEFAARVGSSVMGRLGGRFPRGIALAIAR